MLAPDNRPQDIRYKSIVTSIRKTTNGTQKTISVHDNSGNAMGGGMLKIRKGIHYLNFRTVSGGPSFIGRDSSESELMFRLYKWLKEEK